MIRTRFAARFTSVITQGVATIVATVAVLGATAASGQAAPRLIAASGHLGAATSSYVALDGSPGFPPVANARTDTLYVPIQCQKPATTPSCNHTASHVLDLIDSATCRAHASPACQVVAAATAGTEPVTAAIDRRTDTIYVGDALGGGAGGGTITVVNGAACNVSDTSGCATPVATIKLPGAFPAALGLDPATGTLYVANPNGSVDVVDVSRCDAASAAGCGAPVQTIADAAGPTGLAVDIATDTVYAADGANNENSHTVSVINGATCNAGVSSGCDQTPVTVTVGTSPQWDAVDQTTDTIYVANQLTGTVSLINGATCNGTDTSGCGQTPPAVLTGTGVGYLALDTARHTLFALNQDNDTLSEINLRACNAETPAGCPAEARNEQVPFNPPSGGPANSFAIAGAGGTAFVVNAGGQSELLPVSIAGCSAQDTTGCRVEAPAVPRAEFFPVVDAATHTIYAANTFLPEIDVFDADTCRPGNVSSCTPVAEIPSAGPQANLDAIDDATHTLYAGNVVTSVSPFVPDRTISVIDTAHCSAVDTSGCTAPAPTITVGQYPGPPVLNPATDTLYDVYGGAGNHLAVINVRHCNAEDDSGCGRHPTTIAVAPGAVQTAVSEKTDTIYQQSFNTGKVAVIDGATCNGADHAGCGHIAALVSAGPSPADVVVDDSTDTAYIDTGGDGDSPGSVAIVDTSQCNGSDPSGCGQTWPTVAVGRQPQQMALDPATGEVYVADAGSAGVSVIDGNACNATTTNGCAGPVPFVPTAGGASTLAVDPWSDTVYAAGDIGHNCCGGVGRFSVFGGRR